MKLYAQMTESEKDSLMSAAVKAAYTGGKINVSDFVETEAHFVGYGGSRWLPKIGRILLVLLLALALLAASILHADASAGRSMRSGWICGALGRLSLEIMQCVCWSAGVRRLTIR